MEDDKEFEIDKEVEVKDFNVLLGKDSLPVPHLNNKEDLDDFLKYYYKLPNEISDHQRLGQWVFNVYNIEHENSYNEKNDFRAYVMLLDYFLLKEQNDES